MAVRQFDRPFDQRLAPAAPPHYRDECHVDNLRVPDVRMQIHNYAAGIVGAVSRNQPHVWTELADRLVAVDHIARFSYPVELWAIERANVGERSRMDMQDRVRRGEVG